MIVCVCARVSDRQIRQAACEGAHSLECLQAGLGVATCCGRCADCASGILAEARAQPVRFVAHLAQHRSANAAVDERRAA